jgi:oxidase EvaA
MKRKNASDRAPVKRVPASFEAVVDRQLLDLRPCADGEADAESDGMPRIRDLLQWLDDQRSSQHLYVKRTDLKGLQEWRFNRDGFFVHRSNRFFRVIGLEVESPNREVPGWRQPIIENTRQGVIGLLVRNIEGRRYVLLQAKADVGNRPAVQIGATVQFTPGNYIDNAKLPKPFLFSEFLKPTLGRVVFNALHSEEGARFFRESHLHVVIELEPDRDLDLPDNFRWFSLEAVRFFLHLGETVNSSARSILACLL